MRRTDLYLNNDDNHNHYITKQLRKIAKGIETPNIKPISTEEEVAVVLPLITKLLLTSLKSSIAYKLV